MHKNWLIFKTFKSMIEIILAINRKAPYMRSQIIMNTFCTTWLVKCPRFFNQQHANDAAKIHFRNRKILSKKLMGWNIKWLIFEYIIWINEWEWIGEIGSNEIALDKKKIVFHLIRLLSRDWKTYNKQISTK